jgi:hypothetical protein
MWCLLTDRKGYSSSQLHSVQDFLLENFQSVALSTGFSSWKLPASCTQHEISFLKTSSRLHSVQDFLLENFQSVALSTRFPSWKLPVSSTEHEISFLKTSSSSHSVYLNREWRKANNLEYHSDVYEEHSLLRCIKEDCTARPILSFSTYLMLLSHKETVNYRGLCISYFKTNKVACKESFSISSSDVYIILYLVILSTSL